MKLYLFLVCVQVYFVAPGLSQPRKLSLDLTNAISTIDPEFLSVAIPARLARKDWVLVNFSSPRVIHLAKALRPCIARVGGTMADVMIFNRTIHWGSTPVGIWHPSKNN